MDAAADPSPPPPSAAMKWLYLVSSLLSLLGGSVLFLACYLLWRRKKDQGLLRQLLHLALADIVLAIFTLVINCAVMLGYDELTDDQCGYVVIAYVWIGTNSILYGMILALGILVSSLRAKTPLSLRCAAWMSPLVAFLVTIPHVVHRGYSDPSWPDLCFAKPAPAAITGVFICILFLCTMVIHSVVLSKSYGAAPQSVVRRVAKHALRYLLAFVCTEGAMLVLIVAMLLHTNTKKWVTSKQWHSWRDVAFLLTHLNGFFNFLAFLGHAKGMRKRKRQVRTVAFRDEGLDEVLEISRGAGPEISRPSAGQGPGPSPDVDADTESEDSFIEEMGYRFSFDDSPTSSSGDIIDDTVYQEQLASWRISQGAPAVVAQSEFQSRRVAEDNLGGAG